MGADGRDRPVDPRVATHRPTSDDPRQGPRGPRGERGAAAEAFVADVLRAWGWRVLGRNVRVGGDEVDIVALEPAMGHGGPAPGARLTHRAGRVRGASYGSRVTTLVLVEVRSRSSPAFGDPTETVDAGKVRRLYRAAGALRRSGRMGDAALPSADAWRIDLLVVVGGGRGGWRLVRHIRGLEPP